jgi:hypothetical protein
MLLSNIKNNIMEKDANEKRSPPIESQKYSLTLGRMKDTTTIMRI